MLDAAVGGKVEDCFLAERCLIQIAVMRDQFVVFRLCLGHDQALGIYDDSSSHQRKTVFVARFRHRNDPCRILIGPGLTREFVVEDPVFRYLMS